MQRYWWLPEQQAKRNDRVDVTAKWEVWDWVNLIRFLDYGIGKMQIPQLAKNHQSLLLPSGLGKSHPIPAF